MELAVLSLLVIIAIAVHLPKLRMHIGLREALPYILLTLSALFIFTLVKIYHTVPLLSFHLRGVGDVAVLSIHGKKYVIAGIRVASISNQSEVSGDQQKYADKTPVLSSMIRIVERSSLNIAYMLMISPKRLLKTLGERVACMDIYLIMWSKYSSPRSVEEVSAAVDSMLSVMSGFYPEFEFELIPPEDIQRLVCPLMQSGTSLDASLINSRDLDLLLPLNASIPKLSDIGKFRTIAPPPKPTSPSISLGMCIPVISSPASYMVPISSLLSHVLIAGATGAGKTTIARHIITQLAKLNIPVLVFDLHGEYANIPGFTRLSVRDNTLKLDLLSNPFTECNDDYIDFLIDVFTEVLDLTLPQSVMLSKALEMVIKSDNPSIRGLVKAVESFKVRSYAEYETKMALLRKLTRLTRGQASEIFSSNPVNWKALSSGCCVIDLSSVVSNEVRKLLVYVILRYLYDAIKASGRLSGLQLAVLLEEVEKISPEYSSNDLSIIDYLVSEARKFGVCIIMTAQSISRLSTAILQNTGTKIILRQASLDDIKTASKVLAAPTSVSKMLVNMETGWALIKAPEAPSPTLVKIHNQSPEAS